MRFTFNNSEYSISFTRKTKEIVRFNGEIVQSRFPYTTVTIERVNRDEAGKVTVREVMRTATVGVASRDHFTFEGGRLAALRNVSLTLDKPFKAAVWQAYTKRSRG